jgi:hypothetical protein
MSNAFAPSTWARYSYLNRLATQFCENMNQSMTQETVLLFFEWVSLGVSPPTLKTYAVSFLAMHPELKSREATVWLRSLTHHYGANKPTRQADPLTPADMRALMNQLPADPKWAVWLAWKTASRWAFSI